MTLLIELKDAIDASLLPHLEEPATLCRDALILRLNNGVVMELRFANADEYALTWRYGDAELRIDTAPVDHAVATSPNHLHDADGQVRADPVTQPGAAPLDNVRVLVVAVLADPLFERTGCPLA
jgi:hypothetical protein